MTAIPLTVWLAITPSSINNTLKFHFSMSGNLENNVSEMNARKGRSLRIFGSHSSMERVRDCGPPYKEKLKSRDKPLDRYVACAYEKTQKRQNQQPIQVEQKICCCLDCIHKGGQHSICDEHIAHHPKNRKATENGKGKSHCIVLHFLLRNTCSKATGRVWLAVSFLNECTNVNRT